MLSASARPGPPGSDTLTGSARTPFRPPPHASFALPELQSQGLISGRWRQRGRGRKKKKDTQVLPLVAASPPINAAAPPGALLQGMGCHGWEQEKEACGPGPSMLPPSGSPHTHSATCTPLA